MFFDAGIKETNSWLKELKDNFNTLIESTKFIITLTPKQKPQHQRADYAGDLDAFAKAVEDFLVYIKTGIKTATQIKIYNLKLMKMRTRAILWYEKSFFKCFKSKEDLKKYRDWENLLNRVNNAIEKEVDKSLAETEEKFKARL